MKDNKKGMYASQSGNTLETILVATLTTKGFKYLPYKVYIKTPQNHGDELLLKDVPYTTIYGHIGRTEFVLKSKKYNLEIRIECKWQQVSGSVDEKFPYLYLNCIEKIPEREIYIIIDGPGAKLGAVQWLKNACQNRLYSTKYYDEKNITIFTISEFLAWSNSTFR